MRLCGIDEAGRGALAGPLAVAGVVLNSPIKGLRDSKKLSEKHRIALFDIITTNAQYHIVFCDNGMIDERGMSACLHYALEEIKTYFSGCQILFDGNSSFGVSGISTLIKADTKIDEVSAASILAKVSRDRYMYAIAPDFSAYSFAAHKGYGTALHVAQIEQFGYSKIHRKSFKIKQLREPPLF